MYISNLTHFLDEQGNIPNQMPKEARELASIFALVVDSTTKNHSITLTPTEIRCFNKGCHGTIDSALSRANGEIRWHCSDCENEGVISNWLWTKWNNLEKAL